MKKFYKIIVLWVILLTAPCSAMPQGGNIPDIHISVCPPDSLLSNQNDSYEIAEGADVNITCVLSYWGSERYLNWTHPIVNNEYPHAQNSNYGSGRKGDDVVKRVLQIKKALFLDSGNHSCHFWEHEKEDNSETRTILISVVPKAPVVHVSVEPPSWKLEDDGDGNYTVKEGANVTLTCEFTYTGRTWFLNWTNNHADNEEDTNGTDLVKSTLFIHNIQDDDATGSDHHNIYQCHAYQYHPQQPMEAIYSPKPKTLSFLIERSPPQVIVQAEPNGTLTEESLGEYLIKQGSEIELTCVKNDTIDMFRVIWNISLDTEEDKLSNESSRENILTIPHSSPSDSGNYSCYIKKHDEVEWDTPTVVSITVGDGGKLESAEVDSDEKDSKENSSFSSDNLDSDKSDSTEINSNVLNANNGGKLESTVFDSEKNYSKEVSSHSSDNLDSDKSDSAEINSNESNTSHISQEEKSDVASNIVSESSQRLLILENEMQQLKDHVQELTDNTEKGEQDISKLQEDVGHLTQLLSQKMKDINDDDFIVSIAPSI